MTGQRRSLAGSRGRTCSRAGACSGNHGCLLAAADHLSARKVSADVSRETFVSGCPPLYPLRTLASRRDKVKRAGSVRRRPENPSLVHYFFGIYCPVTRLALRPDWGCRRSSCPHAARLVSSPPSYSHFSRTVGRVMMPSRRRIDCEGWLTSTLVSVSCSLHRSNHRRVVQPCGSYFCPTPATITP